MVCFLNHSTSLHHDRNLLCLNLKSLLTLSGFRQPVFRRPIKNECQSIIARHNARFFYAAVTCNPSASKMHSKKKKISNWYLFLIKKISVWECHVIDNRYIMIQSQVDIMLYWFENWYLNIHTSRWMCVVEKYLWKKKKVGQGDNLWKKSNKNFYVLYFILMKMYVFYLYVFI